MFDILLLGRTNVGKSTLFNLLINHKQALVADITGLTKDWEEGICQLNTQGCFVRVVDTPGVEYKNFSMQLTEPWCTLINQSRLVCLVVDGKQGITHTDKKIAHDLRQLNKDYIVLVNKMDTVAAKNNFTDFFTLAGDQTIGTVAVNRQTRYELCQKLIKYFASATTNTDRAMKDMRSTHANQVNKNRIRLVILGKPNSGKSSLVNRLLGYDRLIVSEKAGTTHNAVTVDYSWRDQLLSLTDTAGIRRSKKIESELEYVTTKQSWQMVKKVSELVLILIDVFDGITKQDWVLLDKVLDMYKPVIICFTKVDLLSTHERSKISRVKHIKSFRLAYISNYTGAGIQNMLQQVKLTHQASLTSITTSRLNKCLQDCIKQVSPPYAKGKRLKLKYIVQTKVAVPTFLIFSNDIIPDDYLTYLRGYFCKTFDLWSIPFKFECRSPQKNI